MSAPQCYSWGRVPKVVQNVTAINWRDEGLPDTAETLLPWGQGRSYGDVCVNESNTVVSTRRLNKFIEFDAESGVLACESGVSLGEILRLVSPYGWFLPVVPGTQFVSAGGAIANDVHGKNHELFGNFGNHVLEFTLLRSDRGRVQCSPENNPELFAATIGGLGLTGLILTATIQLRRVDGIGVRHETIAFSGLEEFRELSNASKDTHEYVVAWVDCVSGPGKLGRGLLSRGNHAPMTRKPNSHTDNVTRLSVPFDFPGFALNKCSIWGFNQVYFHAGKRHAEERTTHYEKFLFPLDSIGDWNRMYGRRGFYQYQCVVPRDDYGPLQAILERIGSSGAGSFLAVLKEFGDMPARGMLSFPRSGVTLALDFPNKGEKTRQLLTSLDELVMEAGGAVYAAKDARMAPAAFARYYQDWEKFAAFIDPRFSSSFWRRVTGESQ